MTTLDPSPQVSVIVPLFNAAAGITAAIGRLGRLQYSNIQLIVVDDASTDETASRARDLISATSDAIFVGLDKNGGPGAARNRGLEHATGKYVWFVDWDDEWDPEIVRVLVSYAENHSAQLTAVRGKWQAADGSPGPITDGSSQLQKVDAPAAFDMLLRGTLRGYLWTKLFRRDALGAAPFPSLRTQEDIWVVADVIASADTIVLAPEVLYTHLVRVGSASNPSRLDTAGLDAVRAHIVGLAAGPRLAASQKSILSFDYAEWLLAKVEMGSRAQGAAGKSVIREALSAMRWIDAFELAPWRPKLALRVLTILALRTNYLRVRKTSSLLRGTIGGFRR